MPSLKPTRAGRLAEDFGGGAREWYTAIRHLVEYHDGKISEGEAVERMRDWSRQVRAGRGVVGETAHHSRREIARLLVTYGHVRLWVEFTVLDNLPSTVGRLTFTRN